MLASMGYRTRILASVQDSLKRLQFDYIDLLQSHGFDYQTPIAETMEALHEVVKTGYVRYIGMSPCHAAVSCYAKYATGGSSKSCRPTDNGF
ncbi:NADP-dependent oxidoreductase domain-containing protein [Mycena albidolilacea]|uniref:NADP-dependent oxidoreductase domain-containing protein n=1 Tax=Mycena albidolilacea TaxID=1033008 RepID=A0AAD7EEW6_9AGAR|nr:NADP-dependent oxidoreductase domain-containing protein [Mycena albidolilacea]